MPGPQALRVIVKPAMATGIILMAGIEGNSYCRFVAYCAERIKLFNIGNKCQ
jgi:hypothetical protein